MFLSHIKETDKTPEREDIRLPLVAFALIALFVLTLTGQCTAMNFLCTPAEGSMTFNNRPTVRISFRGAAIDPGSVKMLLNGEEVTDGAVVSSMFITYNPQKALPDGQNRVKVILKDNRGEEITKEWSFTVKTRQMINSVSHDGTKLITQGQSLTVTMTGRPGCTATFDVGHLKKNIPMKEIKPGTYQGKYQVAKGDHENHAIITAKLHCKGLGSFKKSVKAPQYISASYFRVKITYPKTRQKISRSFKLKGKTLPDVMVNVSSALGFNFDEDAGVGSGGPSTGGFRVWSDENGNFETDIAFPLIAIKGMKLRIYVIAYEKGRRSIPDQVTVIYDPGVKKDKDKDDKESDNKNGKKDGDEKKGDN